MGFISVLFIAIGLSMDAFAVSITGGLAMKRVRVIDALKMAACFGIFQAAMPLIGWMGARSFSAYITQYSHWIALLLLGYIGGKMIYEGMSNKEAEIPKDVTRIGNLLVLGIATSIDALAVGINFALSHAANVPAYCLLIGIITLCLSYLGVFFGKRFGELLGKKAEVFGGLLLIFIGIKVCIEHFVS